MADDKYKIVMTDNHIFPVSVEKEILAEIGAEVIETVCESEEDVIEQCADADGILNVRAKMTRNVFEALKNCKVIARYGIGYDNVDVPAATEHAICVANVRNFCEAEVADTTMSLILAVTRKLVTVCNDVKDGSWDRDAIMPIYRLKGKTLGLIAFGNIARAVAKRAHPFGFRVVAYDPFLPEEDAEACSVELVELDSLIETSDIISVHTPLSDQTKHIINGERLRRMKDTAYLINTSRGPTVDGKALCRALKEGWIAGAAIDVMEQEPPEADDPLLTLDNIIITPHYGGYSEESYHDVRAGAAEAVVAVLSGDWPRYFVNPEVKDVIAKGRRRKK